MVSEIYHLEFLRTRIHEIRSALFSNTSEEVFKLPTCIISALNIDNEGHICFFIRRPELFMNERDKGFPARLDFYKKGKPFFLKISGQAQIFSDAAQMLEYMGLPGNVKLPSLTKLLLVKVKMSEAQYFESKQRHLAFNWKTWWNQLRHYITHGKTQSPTEMGTSYGLHPSV